jgi:hypothetical protein
MNAWDKDNQLNTEAPTELSPEQYKEANAKGNKVIDIKLATG